MEGWTGRPCKVCGGTGVRREDDGAAVPCDACGGHGEEWGELPETPTIDEPE